MQSVSQAWINAQQQIIVPVSFIEIGYKVTDPDADVDASASATSEEPFSNTAQIVDLLEKNYRKYAVLEKNKWILDGSVSIGVQGDTGFVSDVLSGDNAEFDIHPVITVGFSQAHATLIKGITIQWSNAFDECATGFIVTAYNGQTVVASKTVTDNVQNVSYSEFDISGYDRITIEITDWCLPHSRARIEQITLGIVKNFTKSDLLGFTHGQSVDLLSLNLPKAEVSFQINNVGEEWNPDNPDGVYQYMQRRQALEVKYGYNLNGAVEWIMAGRFYLSGWDTPQNGITATFTARDILEYMGNPFVRPTASKTLYELCVMAFEQSNLPQTSGGVEWYVIDESLQDISVTVPSDYKQTCAETVQLCANAARCVMYQDRAGIFHIEPLNTELKDFEITRFISYANADYSFDRQLKSVNVNNGLGTYTVGTDGEEQTISNPLIQSASVANAVAEWVASVLTMRKHINGDFRADPRIDYLDRVTVENKYGTAQAYMTDVKFSYNGAFRGSYEGRVIET